MAARVNDGNYTLYKKLRETGVIFVFLGVESGSTKSLSLFNKQVTVEQNFETTKMLYDLNIIPRIGLIFFEPYMSLKSAKESLEFLQSVASFIFFSINDLAKVDILNGSKLETKFLNDKLIDRKQFTYKDGYKYKFNEEKVEELYRIFGVIADKCYKSEQIALGLISKNYHNMYYLNHMYQIEINELKKMISKICYDTNTNLIQMLLQLVTSLEDDNESLEELIIFICNERENNNLRIISLMKMFENLLQNKVSK